MLLTRGVANFIAFLKELGVPTTRTEMTFGISRDNGAFEWSGTSLGALFAQWSNLFSLRFCRMIFDIIRFNQFALDMLASTEESENDPSIAGRAQSLGAATKPKTGRQADAGCKLAAFESGPTETMNGHAQPLANHSQAASSLGDARVRRRRDEDDAAKSGFAERKTQESIGDYLKREGYSEGFIDDYLIPMTACVWSTSPDKCSLQFPAVTLIRFLWNHHLLNTVSARAPWMTIKEGTKIYIEKALEGVSSSHIHLQKEVESLDVDPATRHVKLQFQDGDSGVFDHVILATHGDQAVEILREAATSEERDILSEFKTNRNVAVLHNDISVRLILSLSSTEVVLTSAKLMPKRQRTWSAWNFMTTSASDWINSVCLTYCMNNLQHIPYEKFGPVLVTLNPLRSPDPASVQGTWTYEHPLYTPEAIRAQEQLPLIQNRRGVSYAGAWTKYGFHEDGFSSGLKVAVEHLGARLPFEFVDSTFSRGRKPELNLKSHITRLLIRLIRLGILMADLLIVWTRHASRRPARLKKRV